MIFDFIIVGQGLAGSVLAYSLVKKNKKVLVIDGLSKPSASKVAAGLYNPVTGMRLVKTWNADILFPFLENFYGQLEAELKLKLIFPTAIFRPFDSIEIQNDWIARSCRPDLIDYIVPSPALNFENFVNAPLGGMLGSKSGYVDVKQLLEGCRNFFIAHESFRNENFDFDFLQTDAEKVIYKNDMAAKIIFCEGINALANPYFSFLPLKAVKGEILDLEINNFDLDMIINKGIYLFKMNNSTFKAGATYHWDENNWDITENGKAEIVEKINKLIRVPYQIVGQRAGVRPASPDRKPIIGLLPHNQNIGIFNGLGTKGVSLAPYFANEFANSLINGKNMDGGLGPGRFL